MNELDYIVYLRGYDSLGNSWCRRLTVKALTAQEAAAKVVPVWYGKVCFVDVCGSEMVDTYEVQAPAPQFKKVVSLRHYEDTLP
jgi:hypothetical protein